VKDLSTWSKQQVTPMLLPLYGPLALCPGCGTPLDGGPVLYRCRACRRGCASSRRRHRVPRSWMEGRRMRLMSRQLVVIARRSRAHTIPGRAVAGTHHGGGRPCRLARLGHFLKSRVCITPAGEMGESPMRTTRTMLHTTKRIRSSARPGSTDQANAHKVPNPEPLISQPCPVIIVATGDRHGNCGNQDRPATCR